MDEARCPMFPLGVAHLPGETVALRVFEPRYVAMTRDLLAGDELVFGSVLITAGSEVGGGERRAGHGVTVRVNECMATPEGGYALLGRADSVVRVLEWLPDDPYPVARVAVVSAEESTDRSSVERSMARLTRLAQNVRILLERVAEASPGRALPGREVMFTLRTIASGAGSEMIGAGSRPRGAADSPWSGFDSLFWLVARAVPSGPLDRLTLLSTTGPDARIAALEAVVDHVREVLEFGL